MTNFNFLPFDDTLIIKWDRAKEGAANPEPHPASEVVLEKMVVVLVVVVVRRYRVVQGPLYLPRWVLLERGPSFLGLKRRVHL
ncbi:MAG: hypothetical protein FJ308_05280 [Planctomycetes bacterium]|nr:hypothetical protein [Planctomycetota bacterium]